MVVAPRALVAAEVDDVRAVLHVRVLRVVDNAALDEEPDPFGPGAPLAHERAHAEAAVGVVFLAPGDGIMIVPAPPNKSVDREGDRIKRNVWRGRYA